MQILWWLAAPLAVTMVAMAWALWAGRPRQPVRADESSGAYESFTRALGRPWPERARTVVHQAPERVTSVAVRRAPAADAQGNAPRAPMGGLGRNR